MAKTRPGFFYVGAAALSFVIAAVWLGVRPYAPVFDADSGPSVTAGLRATLADVGTPLSLAQRDPAAFLDLAAERYRTQVRDYRCVLTKQERLAGELTNVQQVQVSVRREPLAIYMQWRQNADSCKRALYLADDSRYQSDAGGPLARVEPAGLARLVVSDIMMPVDGPRAKAASRHPITRATFGAFFDLLDKYAQLASDEGVYQLSYGGTGEVAGRSTIVIVRELPYAGADGKYPDARLVMHFDRQTLIPAAIYSYADSDETRLLGSYLYTQVELNPGLSAEDFEF